MAVLEAALAWHEAGASVIPIGERRHGRSCSVRRKAVLPAPRRHRADQQLVPAPADCWPRRSSAVPVSVNLEMLELEGRVGESGALLDRLDAVLLDRGLADIWNTSPATRYTEWTPSGGSPLFFCRLDVAGPSRATRRSPTSPARMPRATRSPSAGLRRAVSAAMRIVAPSGGDVHPTGESWMMLRGSIGQIPTIDHATRDALHAAFHFKALGRRCRSRPRRRCGNAARTERRIAPSGLRPGDAWAAVTSWRDILESNGWTYSHSHGDEDFWVRPGKNTHDGHSAASREDANLYVWSSSAGLPIEQPLSKLYIHAHYNHRGDMSAAAAQMRRDGFGADRPRDDFFDAYPKQQTAAPVTSQPTPEQAAQTAEIEAIPTVVAGEPIPAGRRVRDGQADRRCDPGVDVRDQAGPLAVAEPGTARRDDVDPGPAKVSASHCCCAGSPPTSPTEPWKANISASPGRWFGCWRSRIRVNHTIAPRLLAAGADMANW